MLNTQSAAVNYVAHGWALVPLKPADKRPLRSAWNQREQCVTTVEEAATLETGGIGLAHGYSGTCCIDVDDFDVAEKWLRSHNVELAELMGRGDAVMISSGRAGRAKLLYRLPAQVAPPRTRKPVPGLELRCATARGTTVEDALPPTIHPVTNKPYTWAGAGNWRKLPLLPPAVHAAWTAPEDRTVSDNAGNGPVGLTNQALQHLLQQRDPDAIYDEWLRIGMALHHETGGEPRGLDLWDQWSAQGDKYQGKDDLERHYESFGHSDGPAVTARSLMGNGASVASPDEFDVIVDAIEGEAADEPETRPADDRLLTPAEIAARPTPNWLIKGILPEVGLAVLFGEPGSGKSFLAYDMGACLARGVDWNGHKVREARRVAYVAAEGSSGLVLRTRAYGITHPAIYSAPLHFWDKPIDLLTMGHRQLAKLIKNSGGADLIVIDTLARSMPGGNENSSEDMGKVIDHCGKLQRATGALVLLVHHCGKDTTRGARGWSGLRGAADAELEVTRDGPTRSIRVGKQKDGADGAEFPFILNPVDLGRDDDGDTLWSCVVEYPDPAELRREREPAGAKQKLALRIVKECADLADGDVPVDTVLALIARHSADEAPNDARRNGRRALEALAGAGYLEILDGQIRLL